MDGQSDPGRIRRQAAGTRNLNNDFVWPPGFGTAGDVTDNSIVTSNKESKASSELHRIRLELEHEKAKQAIENEMMKKQLKILEMEHQLKEAELLENEDKRTRSNRSNRSNYPIANIQHNATANLPSSRSSVKSNVQKWVNSIEQIQEPEEDMEQVIQKPHLKSDIGQLCDTLNDVLKRVATTSSTIPTPRPEKFLTRNTIEKDFPFFDGRPEEWPTFIYQFRRISTLCEYSNEESMIKLHKCLRGEARRSVESMLMCPENLNQVIRSLEMKFGRPDQIIDTLLEKTRNTALVREYDMEGLINISNHVNGLVSTIKSLRYNAHLQNPQLLRDLVHKLPNTLKLRWGEEICKKGFMNLEDFSKWLSCIADAACFVTSPMKNQHNSSFTPKNTYRHNQTTNRRYEKSLVLTSTKDEEICQYCTKIGHKILECENFKSDDIEKRWEIVTKNKLCFSCLKNNHQTSKCRLRKPCGVNNCRRPHHKLLHKDEIQTTSSNRRQDPEIPSTSRNENVLATGHGANNILLRMVNVTLYGTNGCSVQTIAICDEASTVTLVDESIARQLQIKGTKHRLSVQWTNDIVSSHEDSECFDIDISGDYDGAKIYRMKNVHTVRDLSLPKQEICFDDWKHYHHLNGLPIADINNPPMILIGQDNINLTVPRKIAQGTENLPIATKTNLGWILHGRTETDIHNRTHVLHICENDTSDNALHQLVKHSFTVDAFGVSDTAKCNKEKTSEAALLIMEKTAKRISDNRYEIGLLWKSTDISLPSNKSTALRRLQHVENQMTKDDHFKQKYHENIQKYLEKGYIRKLTHDEATRQDSRTWFLPHFGVINSNKPDKLRLVFDAASKSGGTSLNDNLFSGPDLLEPLLSVLLRFRQRRVAFTSDVREMFHQVRIRHEDQSAQSFLWRDEPSKPPDIYRMQVMTFGATCSPACAQFVKNLNAREMGNEERIIYAITKNHYVDDYLDSADNPYEAFEIISKVYETMKKGGFELVNWSTNSKELTKMMTFEDSISKDLILDCDKSVHRVLGMYWDSSEDTFVFRIKNVPLEDPSIRPTKRHLLKIVMAVFDPLGLLINFTIRGRMLIQDVWRTGIGWDDSIDEETHKKWTAWLSDLKKINNITVSRCYSRNIPKANRIDLHIFCDASKQSFAAVAYLRVVSDDNIDVVLVSGKARVAPTKPISIPRLELQAALLGSRLGRTIKIELNVKIDKIFYWSDSTTVLYWINGDFKRLGQFEAHRIGEILELTDTSDWQWVPSKMNGADVVTRSYNEDGSNTVTFHDWFSGPKFLSTRDESTWPRKDILGNTICNDKEIIMLSTTKFERNTILPNIDRFSDFKKLLRVTAWTIKIAKIWFGKIRQASFNREITAEDFKYAELLWLQECQKESFPEEYEILMNNKQLPKQSRLKNLSPTMSPQGTIIMMGRTDLATSISDTAKRPAILPNKHRYTYLFLKSIHEKYAHQGVELVFNEARQKYWIIHGRAAVKFTFSKCQRCRLEKSKPLVPLMGQLPIARLTPNVRPFTYTGIDYFGPFLVTVGRGKAKRWGVIFTCLTTRAIHLEVAHTLTADSAIMALKRMIARRGQPQQILSDNGTNLRGASEELRKAIKELDRKKINSDMTNRGIDWKFIPPGSPHMGGAWERLIRNVKTSFNAILRNQQLKDELLLTIFAEVEFMVNSRPLTKVSSDPNDFEALTPNHFLIGTSNGTRDLDDIDGQHDLRKQWRRGQQITTDYWRRWMKEYIPSLTKRSRWTDDNQPIKVNDIVVILNETLQKRNDWTLGRVEKLFPGADGRIRVVEVRTKNGVFKRPVTKLGRIPMED